MQNLVDRLLNAHNILSWSIPDLKNEKLVTDHRSRVKGFKTVSLLAVTLSRPCEQALNLFPFACGSRVTSREPPNGELARARALDYITRLALNFTACLDLRVIKFYAYSIRGVYWKLL